MATMISNLKTPYYYCTQTCYQGGDKFCIGWEYPKRHIDRFMNRDLRSFKFKENFRLVE